MHISYRSILPVFALLAFLLSGTARAEDDPYVRLFQVQLATAQKGEPRAMYALAEMYENGLGTPENHEKAIEWYKRAADGGHWLAKKRLEEESKTIEIARARDDSEKALQAARARAAAEAKRAAEAAEAAKRKGTDRKLVEVAKAAEISKRKAEEEALKAAARAAKLEAERQASAARLAKRKAAAKKAMEAIIKQSKAAEGVIE